MVTHHDTGYAWVVCAASFFSHVFQCGVLYSMGMLYIILRQNLDADSAEVSFVSSINAACSYGTGPLSGVLVARFGGRVVGMVGSTVASLGYISSAFCTNIYQLHITFGIIGGCGQGMAYLPSVSMLATYFRKRRGVATGLALCGCGIGSLVFPVLIEFFTTLYGWRGALLLTAAINMNTIVCGALYRPLPEPKAPDDSHNQNDVHLHNREDAGSATTLDTDHELEKHPPKDPVPEAHRFQVIRGCLQRYLVLLRIRNYVLFGLSQVTVNMAMMMIYTHFGAFSMDHGCSRGDVSILFFAMGIAATVTRPLSGAITQLPWCRPIRIYAISIIVLSVITFCVGHFDSMPSLLGYGVVFGILSSPFTTYNVLIVAELVSIDQVSTALGFILLALVPGALLGGPIAGITYDKTQTYETSFHVAAGLMLVGGAVVLPALLKGGKKQTTQNSVSEEGDIAQ